MKMIKPSVKLIKETNPFKRIEIAGRTCYKSEQKTTKDSCYAFYKTLVNNKHHAMLEHAHFVFEVSAAVYDYISSRCSIKYLNLTSCVDSKGVRRFLVSGNLRAINESSCPCLLDALREEDERLAYLPTVRKLEVEGKARVVDVSGYSDLTIKEFHAHSFFTYRIITDRGVTHELVRHRPASFAQESTRFCNYTKNGAGLTFIEPSTWDSWTDQQQMFFITQMKAAEQTYLALTMNESNKSGLSPQQSRAVLPNAIKTEIIVSMNVAELLHFFKLRLYGATGKPHPDMKVIAEKMFVFYEKEENHLAETLGLKK